MGKRLLVPAAIIIVGVTWFIGSLLLPRAPLGRANAPIYFPMVVSLFLVIMGIVYFVQEWKIRHKEKNIIKALTTGRVPQLIGITLVLSIIYSIVFEFIGFLISTILFLGLLLSFINGWKKWLTNSLVAVIFTFILWYGFVKLLGISLPHLL